MRAPAPAFVSLVAWRMLLRARASRAALVVSALALALSGVACALMITASSHSIAIPLLAAVGALLAVGALCVRYLTPTVAVSVFGMVLGCAALMTVFAVTSGFERELTLRLSQVNGHVLLTKYGLDFRGYEAIADRWRDDPRVTAASPFAYSMAALVPVRGPTDADADTGEGGGDDGDDEDGDDADDDDDDDDYVASGAVQPAVVVGKALDPERAAGMSGLLRVTASGTLDALRPADTRHLPGIALGVNLGKRLGVGPGDHVRMVIPSALGTPGAAPRPPRHAVFEVLDRLDTGVSELDNSFVLIHLSAGQALFFRQRRVTGIEFELVDPDRADEVARDIIGELNSTLFRVSTWKQHSASTLAGLRQIRAAVGLVLGLLELVAGTALIASLLLLVRRKRVEIASLMALGADGVAVFSVFEGVGLVVGGLGALGGLSVGAFFCWLLSAYRYPLDAAVYPIDHLPVAFSLWDVVVPAAAALAICALVSGPVAAVAARLPVLEGLRR